MSWPWIRHSSSRWQTAPARYRELLDGLPGVATNLLTDRLRDLETAGAVERRPADATPGARAGRRTTSAPNGS
jgi:DNA-binding HxlR family transcriptional regulator